MTVVAGCAPRESDNAALELAAMMARSTGEDVVVAVVVAAAWPTSTERVDAEYRAYLTRHGEQSLEQARAWMPADVKSRFVLHHAASIPTGLLEVAEDHDASVMVLGSADSGGLGHVSLGSVTDRIVHSSPVTVVLAPRGFEAGPGGRVRRVTAAFGGTRKDQDVVRAAAEYAARTDSTMRVAAFSVRPKMLFAATLAGAGEDLVVEEWSRRTRQVIDEQLDEVCRLAGARPPEIVLGDGYGWREAMGQARWSTGDLLVVGSSSHGPLASVFLGSRASKILRYAPVPVIAVPRAHG